MQQIRIRKLIAIIKPCSMNTADVVKEAELSVAAMKKQKAKYEEALQCPVAYKVALNSVSMRNALVKNGASFVDLPSNAFLPFMGIILQDVYRKQLVKRRTSCPGFISLHIQRKRRRKN